MTVKEFLKRYDNKERFTDRELRDIYWGDLEADADDEVYEEDEEYGDKGRWSRYETKYYCINNRYFACTADIGLTEYQENYYNIQPTEVKRVKKLVEVISWEAV